MTENQKQILTIAYELETMSNVLKTNLKRLHNTGLGIQSQDVERCVLLHEKAVALQGLAKE